MSISAHRRPGLISLADLAEKLDGRLDGPAPGPMIRGIASLEDAGPEEITFLSGAKNAALHLSQLETSSAGAVIAAETAGPLPLPSIRFAKEYEGFMKAMQLFFPPPVWKPGIHPTAFVHEDARVDPSASIGPLAVVEEGASIGARTRIDAQVFIGAAAVVAEQS